MLPAYQSVCKFDLIVAIPSVLTSAVQEKVQIYWESSFDFPQAIMEFC